MLGVRGVPDPALPHPLRQRAPLPLRSPPRKPPASAPPLPFLPRSACLRRPVGDGVEFGAVDSSGFSSILGFVVAAALVGLELAGSCFSKACCASPVARLRWVIHLAFC